MKHDIQLSIATGSSAKSKKWTNKKILWSEMVERLRKGHRTNVTFKEYKSANKMDQGKIKDVGGYVGGFLRQGKRSPANVAFRQLLTLDVDFAHLEFWEDFSLQYENAAVLHATHTHSDEAPRYRLIIPLDREVTPDEYSAVSRKVAGILGIELFDNTTFETNRLMFWPSTPMDREYYFKQQDGPLLSADEVLEEYEDWRDSSQWPISEAKLKNVHEGIAKQEDPGSKRGLIGAFCRSYTISEVIETYLSEHYEHAQDGRYTYKKGSTAGGLVVYDDTFAYSHHGTDPSSGTLCNVYDLVRLHKFGHLDAPQSDAKSSSAMSTLIMEDKAVKKLVASENMAAAKYDFAAAEEGAFEEEVENMEWMSDLEMNGRGEYVSSAQNLNLIFEHDPRVKHKFQHNYFDNKIYTFPGVPWRKIESPEPMKNVDFSGLRNYIETIYKIAGTLKIEDAFNLEAEKRKFHPVRDYLNSLEWDGVKRIDSLLVDYFGAPDTIYTREAIRKTLVAAVARIYNHGAKFDLVLTIVGPQGTKKSTFFSKLGKGWFSDTFLTVHGKEALEQIQGVWIMEIAELAGLRKAEVETVKHFISKQEDSFRPAYGRTTETHKRQTVFVGTTNNDDFLNDPSGNRRFIPIRVNAEGVRKDVFRDLSPEIDLIWAEAVNLYRSGEPLYMSKEAETLAQEAQREHSENDERQGPIEAFLDANLPADWHERNVAERREYLRDPLSAKGTERREVVCVAEIWCECLEMDKKDMNRYKTREINNILKSLDNWTPSHSTKNFNNYGKQKYYVRERENNRGDNS